MNTLEQMTKGKQATSEVRAYAIFLVLRPGLTQTRVAELRNILCCFWMKQKIVIFYSSESALADSEL
jgi:hypothetical protein